MLAESGKVFAFPFSTIDTVIHNNSVVVYAVTLYWILLSCEKVFLFALFTDCNVTRLRLLVGS